jgi:uncharacterized protein YeaO (DUF488 family)
LPRADWKRAGCFDVWLPAVAPSPELVAKILHLAADDTAARKALFDKYERELLGSAESRQTVALLAEMAARMPVSIGCFCADESRCHRSRLYQVILKQSTPE